MRQMIIALFVIFTLSVVHADEPPPRLKAAFDMLNSQRIKAGRPPFKWDNRLANAAQAQADWDQTEYVAGRFSTARAHEGWDIFLSNAGWKGKCSQTGASGDSSSDGSYRTTDGWTHPPVDPVANLKFWTDWDMQNFKTMPYEIHIKNFMDANWTHVGLGWNRGFLITNYGHP